MALLGVVHYGNPILRKECKPVTDYSILPELLEDMFDTMYEEEGIGLAANQVGIDLNLMIIDVSHTDEAEDACIFVNGEIIDSSGLSEMEEGCLSIPEIRLPVKRPEIIKFKYQLPDGSEHIDEFSGLLGRAIQHEMDHLKGVFIIDRVNPLLAMKYKKKLKEIKGNSINLNKSKNKKRDFVL
ncbi:MAG: peptide deformylase [Candidatus Marinimicrobia bacterium]|nr:peptide deformylase [Candidatus Neomarinimicrobiota bacterium]